MPSVWISWCWPCIFFLLIFSSVVLVHLFTYLLLSLADLLNSCDSLFSCCAIFFSPLCQFRFVSRWLFRIHSLIFECHFSSPIYWSADQINWLSHLESFHTTRAKCEPIVLRLFPLLLLVLDAVNFTKNEITPLFKMYLILCILKRKQLLNER